MLNADLLFNLHSLRSYTLYECALEDGSYEKELSFHVALGPSTERHGDIFPAYEVPPGKMVWVSDWSFNGGHLVTQQTAFGGSLGRITRGGEYSYVLNCAVYSGQMQIYSPARPVRYLPGEWLAVCFHHAGLPLDAVVRATFRFTEIALAGPSPQARIWNWWAASPAERFDPAHIPPSPADSTKS